MKTRNESGFDAGWRNIGRQALSTVPLCLGLGACVWLGFFAASRGWFIQWSQEQRQAIYVGAFNRPKGKLIIETPDEGCIAITHVDLDGSSAAVYFQNNCGQTIQGISVHWQLISPNGTALAGEDAPISLLDGPPKLNDGEQGEAKFDGGWFGLGYYSIPADNRAKSIRFWATHY